jgi:hypothetical protein
MCSVEKGGFPKVTLDRRYMEKTQRFKGLKWQNKELEQEKENEHGEGSGREKTEVWIREWIRKKSVKEEEDKKEEGKNKIK